MRMSSSRLRGFGSSRRKGSVKIVSSGSGGQRTEVRGRRGGSSFLEGAERLGRRLREGRVEGLETVGGWVSEVVAMAGDVWSGRAIAQDEAEGTHCQLIVEWIHRALLTFVLLVTADRAARPTPQLLGRGYDGGKNSLADGTRGALVFRGLICADLTLGRWSRSGPHVEVEWKKVSRVLRVRQDVVGSDTSG